VTDGQLPLLCSRAAAQHDDDSRCTTLNTGLILFAAQTEQRYSQSARESEAQLQKNSTAPSPFSAPSSSGSPRKRHQVKNQQSTAATRFSPLPQQTHVNLFAASAAAAAGNSGGGGGTHITEPIKLEVRPAATAPGHSRCPPGHGLCWSSAACPHTS
jgi:hypothetical protein